MNVHLVSLFFLLCTIFKSKFLDEFLPIQFLQLGLSGHVIHELFYVLSSFFFILIP